MIHVSENTSFTYLLIINAVGIPGRLLPALLADIYGSITLLIPIVFIVAMLLYCWTAVHTSDGIIAFIVFYGLFGAAIQGLFPSSIASLTSDIQKVGVRIGMTFGVVSIACLTGPPLAGALIQAGGGSYVGAQVWGGSVLVLGGSLLLAARLVQRHTARKVL